MEMKEEWLMPGAVVPVDAETTAALVAEIKRLIGVVGGMALGMQPAQEPVAFYVYKPTLPQGHLGNVSDGDLPWVYDQDPSSGYSARMLVYTTLPHRKPWVGLTEQEHIDIAVECGCMSSDWVFYGATVERLLKEKNC